MADVSEQHKDAGERQAEALDELGEELETDAEKEAKAQAKRDREASKAEK